MNTNNFSQYEKNQIAHTIKPITIDKIVKDFNKLQHNITNLSLMSRVGNDMVDYYTFAERLNTKGKYNASFYDFLANIEDFKKKKFIKNMFDYYERVKNKNKTKHPHTVAKEVYNICISAINIFRPVVAADIYRRYKPTSVLDFTCGWGGRLVAACALNVPKYTGIDMNENLTEPYEKLINEMRENPDIHTTTQAHIYCQDALTFDYASLEYDCVLTSPPYYSIEQYSNNEKYLSHDEMNRLFYIPLFYITYKHLQIGGRYCLNVNAEIYNTVCVPLFGEANELIPLSKSKRNNYVEFIYVWKKGKEK
jgi:2-polyprenyl-3-methyl-5-hydroxy-6-metoxy-1,4-benzoquinol methylase